MKLASKLIICALATSATAPAAEAPPLPPPLTGPAIEGFGPFVPVPEPGFPTPVSGALRAVFDVAQIDDSGKANRRLESAARFMNMHADAGMAPAKLAVAIVVHGPAARDLLSDQAYLAREGTANPSAALLRAMMDAGVEVILCGQTAAFGGYRPDELLPGVKLALSAMTALVSLQDQGYRIIAF